jgi:mannose-6-phosphate isomerase-like protein (cupin superfamily)
VAEAGPFETGGLDTSPSRAIGAGSPIDIPSRAKHSVPRIQTALAFICLYSLRDIVNAAKGEIMSVSRRELCSMLPAVLIPALLPLEASAREDKAMPSAMFPFEKMAVRAADSAQYREALKGKLATGESLEVHETTLAPGGAPHPPHHHAHSEIWMIREGTVEITVNGKSYQLGPGSVGFVRSNDEHGIKNAGTTPATYFVVEIGPGVDA